VKIITISAKAGGGKDTTALQIKIQLEDMGYSVLVCHYADLLKYICQRFFDWNGYKDEEGRTLLQRVGTDTVRKQNPDYWVDFLKGIFKMFPDEWDYVLIPDARFPNEIESMKKDFDCISLHVIRPGYENYLTEEQRNHSSETALDNYKFDYEIINPGTINGLQVETQDFVNLMFQNNIKKDLIGRIKERL